MSDIERRNRILFLLNNMKIIDQESFKLIYGGFLANTVIDRINLSNELSDISMKDIVFAIPYECLSTCESQIQTVFAKYID